MDKNTVKDIRKTLTDSVNEKLKELDSAREILCLVMEELDSDEAILTLKKAAEIVEHYKAGVVDTLKLIDYDLKIEEEF